MPTLNMKNSSGVTTGYSNLTSEDSDQLTLKIETTGGSQYFRLLRNVLVPSRSYSTNSLSSTLKTPLATAGFYNSSTSFEIFFQQTDNKLYRTTFNLNTAEFSSPVLVYSSAGYGIKDVLKLNDGTIFVHLRASSGYSTLIRQYQGTGSFVSVSLPYTTGAFRVAKLSSTSILVISTGSSSPYYWRYWTVASDGTNSGYTVDSYALDEPSNIIPVTASKFLVASAPKAAYGGLTEGQFYYRFYESGALSTPIAFGNNLGSVSITGTSCRLTRPNYATSDNQFTASICYYSSGSNKIFACENYSSGFYTNWVNTPFTGNVFYLTSPVEQEAIYYASNFLTFYRKNYGVDTTTKTIYPLSKAGLQIVDSYQDVGTLYE